MKLLLLFGLVIGTCSCAAPLGDPRPDVHSHAEEIRQLLASPEGTSGAASLLRALDVQSRERVIECLIDSRLQDYQYPVLCAALDALDALPKYSDRLVHTLDDRTPSEQALTLVMLSRRAIHPALPPGFIDALLRTAVHGRDVRALTEICVGVRECPEIERAVTSEWLLALLDDPYRDTGVHDGALVALIGLAGKRGLRPDQCQRLIDYAVSAPLPPGDVKRWRLADGALVVVGRSGHLLGDDQASRLLEVARDRSLEDAVYFVVTVAFRCEDPSRLHEVLPDPPAPCALLWQVTVGLRNMIDNGWRRTGTAYSWSDLLFLVLAQDDLDRLPGSMGVRLLKAAIDTGSVNPTLDR